MIKMTPLSVAVVIVATFALIVFILHYIGFFDVL